MIRVRIRRAAAVIRRGGIIIYPTDTLYGLGASALDQKAVERVYEIKKRPMNQPISVATALKDLDLVARTEGYDDIIARLLPGPVTLLLPAQEGIPAPLVQDGKVGIRMPDDPVTRALLDATGPLTATSANLAGESPEPEPRDSPVVRHSDYVLRDGPRQGEPSTVFDAVTGEVVREGALGREKLEERLAQAQDT